MFNALVQEAFTYSFHTIIMFYLNNLFTIKTYKNNNNNNFIYPSMQMFLPFPFVCREPTTWPANNCLQIMVCSCAMPFKCFWLQIRFYSGVNETTLFSFLRSLLVKMADRFVSRRYSLKKNKLGDRMIKQLLNSVIAKYRDLSVSRRSIICVSLRLRQI